MKKRLAGVLVAIAVAISGCSSAVETTLRDWVSEAGLPLVIQESTSALSEVAQELQNLSVTPENVEKIVTALKASAVALSAQATALAAEPISNDAAFEELRTNVLNSMNDFVTAANALDAAALLASGDISAVSAAIGTLTAVATQLTDLNTYLDSNGGEQVEPAEG